MINFQVVIVWQKRNLDDNLENKDSQQQDLQWVDGLIRHGSKEKI